MPIQQIANRVVAQLKFAVRILVNEVLERQVQSQHGVSSEKPPLQPLRWAREDDLRRIQLKADACRIGAMVEHQRNFEALAAQTVGDHLDGLVDRARVLGEPGRRVPGGSMR